MHLLYFDGFPGDVFLLSLQMMAVWFLMASHVRPH